jgi:hypothetical protein
MDEFSAGFLLAPFCWAGQSSATILSARLNLLKDLFELDRPRSRFVGGYKATHGVAKSFSPRHLYRARRD